MILTVLRDRLVVRPVRTSESGVVIVRDLEVDGIRNKSLWLCGTTISEKQKSDHSNSSSHFPSSRHGKFNMSSLPQ